jgi:hypothetical protein
MGASASAELKSSCANLTDEDVRNMQEKYESLKAEGVTGKVILQQLCVDGKPEEITSTPSPNKANNRTTVGAEDEDEMTQSPEMALEIARERVAILNRAIAAQSCCNFLVGADGAKPSELALEVFEQSTMCF